MLDDERRGVVERAGNGWRLTVRAEREFGGALALLGPEESD
jgi:hypothetical protein